MSRHEPKIFQKHERAFDPGASSPRRSLDAFAQADHGEATTRCAVISARRGDLDEPTSTATIWR
jgi:hypothetical protein